MFARPLDDASSRLRYTPEDFRHSPLIVFYELTQACDLVCAHCRACAQTRAHPEELTTEAAVRLIDELADFPKPPMLVLTGGDPLKRPDLYQLIRHGVRRRLEVSITPSATPLADEEAVRRLAEVGISRMAVSIDAASAADHDRFRGVAGSFERSWHLLHWAREQGVSTQVNTTITSENCDQIEALAERLDTTGITLWSVFFLVPVGRGTTLPRLHADQFEQVFAWLFEQAQRRSFQIKTTEAPHYRRFVLQELRHQPRSERRRVPTLGVNDGKGVMFIGHTGLIYPSGFMPLPCGLFPQDNVVTIYQSSPIFQTLRDSERLEGKCGLCEFRSICGGSRARAYAVTGNMFAQEPDCAYQPPKYVAQHSPAVPA